MTFRIEIIETILDEFEGNPPMGEIVYRSTMRAGLDVSDTNKMYILFTAAVRAQHVGGELRLKNWLQSNPRFLSLSHALWDDRPREVCRSIGLRCIGANSAKGAGKMAYRKPAREGDKRHDWRTVK